MASSTSASFPLHATLVEALLAAPDDAPFVTLWCDEDDVTTLTFGEFRRQAEAQAACFEQRGVKLGDRIILVMPHDVRVMAAFAGAMLLGAVPSIFAYPNFKADPVKYRSGLRGASRNLSARLIVVDDDFPSELLGHVSVGEGAELLRYTPAPAGPPPAGPRTLPQPDDLAFIQHSAGTTGLQKGVALTHAAVLRQIGHLAEAIALDRTDRLYSWLPLYHDMGLIACFMLPLACHLPVIMQSPISWVMRPASMLSLIAEYRCTLSWVPNFTLQFVSRRVAADDVPAPDLSCLRLLINCSEPVRARSLDEFHAAALPLGLPSGAVQTSYAMAENVFAVTQSDVRSSTGPARIFVDADALARGRAERVDPDAARGTWLVSSGRCVGGTRIRIISTEGVDLPDGYVGEILIQSDTLFSGYYNRPDLTALAVKDGWYWSRDVGFLLDGGLFVLGRKDDIIIVAGKNLSPHDIEEIVCADPRIRDGRAVAFGLFNQELGTDEAVVVAEVADDGDCANAVAIERALRQAVSAELGVSLGRVHVKPPKWIVKSTAGKAARSATREKLLAEYRSIAGNEHHD